MALPLHLNGHGARPAATNRAAALKRRAEPEQSRAQQSTAEQSRAGSGWGVTVAQSMRPAARRGAWFSGTVATPRLQGLRDHATHLHSCRLTGSEWVYHKCNSVL